MTSISSAQKFTRRTLVKATAAAGGGLILSLSFPRLNAVLAAELNADFAPNAFVRMMARSPSQSRKSRWGRASTLPFP